MSCIQFRPKSNAPIKRERRRGKEKREKALETIDTVDSSKGGGIIVLCVTYPAVAKL